MITLYRMIRIWQLKTKWKFEFWHLVDGQVMQMIKNPKELEKKLMDSLAEIIHKSNQETQSN